MYIIHRGHYQCCFVKLQVCVCVFTVWREGSCLVESRPEETRPSLRKVRSDTWVDIITETRTILPMLDHIEQQSTVDVHFFNWHIFIVRRWIYFWFERLFSPLFLPEASEIMREIGTAIDYLHNVNIAHRDIKVHRKGDQYQQKINRKNITFFSFFCLLSSQRTCCTHRKIETLSSNWQTLVLLRRLRFTTPYGLPVIHHTTWVGDCFCR